MTTGRAGALSALCHWLKRAGEAVGRGASVAPTPDEAGMDRNPSPPSSDSEDDAAAGDSIGSTVYSKHWLFSVLTKLIEIRCNFLLCSGNAQNTDVIYFQRVLNILKTEEEIKKDLGDLKVDRFLTRLSCPSPGKDDAELNNMDGQVDLDEDLESDICKIWDMSMDKDVALFLQEFNTPDIFMGVFTKSKCPRLIEICVGILGNMACCQNICMAFSKDENLGQLILQRLCDSDPPTLLETSRLLLTCLCHPEAANIWVKRIRGSPSVYDCLCFIMTSSTNVELLVKVGEVVDKVFDLDEELMLKWIKNGSHQAAGQPTDDSPDDFPNFKLVPCLLEAAKQVCSDNNIEGLDVFMHVLQLLTTVDEGIQAIVQTPDGGKETWNLLYDLFCNELCQPDDPPIIVQEQKTVLASILSVLSAIYTSQTEKEYVKIGNNIPLIGSLIRVLQNLEECGKISRDSSEESKSENSVEDFHFKILKDICCELLANIFQELSKENILEGLKQGHLSEQKCSCAFQNLLPFYFSSVESFLEVLHEADQSLADTVQKSFPSLKLQT